MENEQAPSAALSITTQHRSDDWIAFTTGDTRVWEAGRTELEAIGRLIVSLAAQGCVELINEGRR